jgi:hypothetical protein
VGLEDLQTSGEVGGELLAGTHVELLEGVPQVSLHSGQADRDGLRYLLVRVALGRQVGDATLGAGESVNAAEREPARSRAAGL